MTNKRQLWFRSLILAVGVVLASFVLLIWVYEATMIYTWQGSGFSLTSLSPGSSPYAVVFRPDPPEFEGAVPQPGDTLTMINGEPATLDLWIDQLESPHTPNQRNPIRFRHQGVEYQTTLISGEVSRLTFFGVASAQILKFLLILAFFGLGFHTLTQRSLTSGVMVIALYAFSVGSFMGTTYMPMYEVMAMFTIPYIGVIRLILASAAFLSGSFWLLLNLFIPRRSRLLERWPIPTYLACFAPQLVIIAWSPPIYIHFGPLNILANQIGYWLLTAQVLAGLGLLRWHQVKANNNIERRQAKLIFYGSGLGLLLLLAYLLDQYSVAIYMRKFPLWLRLGLRNILFLTLLASPLSFIYAFRKFRLLEVEGRLHRGSRLLISRGLLFALLAGAVYLVGIWLPGRLNVQGVALPVVMTALLLIVVLPLQRRAIRSLENGLFPERRRLQAMARDFIEIASMMPDRFSLAEQVEMRLPDVLGRKVYAILQTEPSGHFQQPNGIEAPIDRRGSFFKHISESNAPLMVDEAIASNRIVFSNAESKWGADHKVTVILPLQGNSGLQGLIAIGRRDDREDFHPGEIRSLTILARQIGLILENLLLIEEDAERRRLKAELNMAREVQKRFLPLVMPATPGLQVAARSTFSLEVAGDYYDVIPQSNGRVILAMADVSGKGAGAALIMANLQASLRAFSDLGLDLTEVTSRINEMIYHNTDSEQFVTFFVAEYNPESRELTYVNAGHNPPIVRRDDQSLYSMEEGGLVLGAFSGSRYDRETITLAHGEVLLFYTDGVSEAMNDRGDEYGTGRLERILLSANSTPPDQLLDTLFEDLIGFQRAGAPSDDMTMMIARVN